MRIRDILIISTPEDIHNFQRLLGTGCQFGVNFKYAVQPSPGGLAQAFLIGEEFIAGDDCTLILGDNIFYGNGLSKFLQEASHNKGRATVFGYYVEDPRQFEVVELDNKGQVLSVEEKPVHPKSNYVITGLYFYDTRVVEYAKNLKPSLRGELEITDLNRMYLEEGQLDVKLLGQGFAWLDTGTIDSLLEAAEFIKTIEKRQGIKIAAPEEIAYVQGWIPLEQILEAANRYGKSPYGHHLRQVAKRLIVYAQYAYRDEESSY